MNLQTGLLGALIVWMLFKILRVRIYMVGTLGIIVRLLTDLLYAIGCYVYLYVGYRVDLGIPWIIFGTMMIICTYVIETIIEKKAPFRYFSLMTLNFVFAIGMMSYYVHLLGFFLNWWS